ncbi:cell division protein FtsB [Sedimentibacter acidaminivorans]|uniref:Cell division protein FtsB n=1 Tax=Sedimentibacter acidaminivorans TaxID=913099 RepID=A0ABS4GFG5_9FIRM|nr:hypothetical protein [Sedimentibacter acidaminivorans]MBP1926426.1 cell division protein FtsB [Sedimentibacter acidaminivorans]
MKKLAIILLITIFIAFGCTRLPASQETGVKPGEYKSSNILNFEETKTENDKLKRELEQTKVEIQKLKDDYISIARNNDLLVGKLDEAESLLRQLENEGAELPKFVLEETDKNSIINYIKERKSVLSKNFKDIKLVPTEENDNIILFYTVGYGENYNQIFIWEVGKSEPITIDSAFFSKDGNWEWLQQGKYILIDSGKGSIIEKKILDINAMKIVSTFETNSEDIYLFPETSSLLIQKAKTGSSEPIYEIYNFITGEESKLNFEFNDKYLRFNVDSIKNTINFSGTYVDIDNIEYSVKVSMDIDIIKEKYSIKALEELREQNNDIINQEETNLNEEGNE